MDRHRYPVVVHVLLLRGARLFLLRRARTGFMDGWYVPPGGHQRPSESVSGAARRECFEETGVNLLALRPSCVLPYGSSEAGRGVNFVFEASRWHGEPTNAEPQRCDHAGWHALDALPEPHPSWLTAALRLRRQAGWYAELE